MTCPGCLEEFTPRRRGAGLWTQTCSYRCRNRVAARKVGPEARKRLASLAGTASAQRRRTMPLQHRSPMTQFL